MSARNPRLPLVPMALAAIQGTLLGIALSVLVWLLFGIPWGCP